MALFDECYHKQDVMSDGRLPVYLQGKVLYSLERVADWLSG